MSRQDRLHYSGIYLDLVDRPWAVVRGEVKKWLADMGIVGPADRPAWVGGASIYEVQIGYSVFAGGYRYEPYPTVQDVRADIGRIQELRFDTIQIMPRQPFPSYNVYDYSDISTTYGEETVLRSVVEDCHGRGMRVILDLLMHGVIDREAVEATARAVREGPFAGRLEEDTGDGFTEDLAHDRQSISWSRHILDFERYWTEGSVEHHPLIDEHPEWFCRDSAGNVTGMYSKAFDVSDPGWHQYFLDSTLALLRRLDLDGFRLDAPTYNWFPNWDKAKRNRASRAPLAVLELFRRLRREMKAEKPDAVLYTEPPGILFRQSADIAYNYDEQWLFTSVIQPIGELDDTRRVRTGKELAEWMRDRDCVLPSGSMTAHHVDSHDTFWWPLPGKKWRREQIGIDATRAFVELFGLCGGPFMTFVGGEEGLEGTLARVNLARGGRPELAWGASVYEGVSSRSADVFLVMRHYHGRLALVATNLSGRAVDDEINITLPYSGFDAALRCLAEATGDGNLFDLLAREGLSPLERTLRGFAVCMHFGPWQSRLVPLCPRAHAAAQG